MDETLLSMDIVPEKKVLGNMYKLQLRTSEQQNTMKTLHMQEMVQTK